MLYHCTASLGPLRQAIVVCPLLKFHAPNPTPRVWRYCRDRLERYYNWRSSINSDEQNAVMREEERNLFVFFSTKMQNAVARIEEGKPQIVLGCDIQGTVPTYGTLPALPSQHYTRIMPLAVDLQATLKEVHYDNIPEGLVRAAMEIGNLEAEVRRLAGSQ